MKKILMSLGFAAATILAAQAQEVPQDQQDHTQTQEQNQQNFPEEPTQEQNQQQFPEEPTQEQYPEDQQDPTMQQDPNLEQDPNMEQDPTLQQDPSLEQHPEMEEDSNLGQDPALNQDPNLEQNPEEQSTQDTQIQQDQSTTDQQQGQQSQDQPLEGMSEISESELPQEVIEGIENSDYQGATIGQAYEITGTAVDQILNNRQGVATGPFSNTNSPNKLYQVQVTTEDDKSAILYLTEDGEVYEEKQL